MPPTSLPDLQTLVHRFLAALETAETSLTSLTACLSQLDQLTRSLDAATPQLAGLKDLPAEMRQAADHLARSLRPSMRRIWLQATAVSLGTCAFLLIALTCLRPQWTLSSDQARQLRLGQSIERLYQEMPAARRGRLLELLDPTSTRSLSSKP